MDQILWIMDQKWPRRIASYGGRPIKGPPVLTKTEQTSDAPDHQVATFEFDGFTVGWEHRQFGGNNAEKGESVGCYFYGTEGTFHMGWQKGWTFYPADGRKEPIHEDPQLHEPDQQNIAAATTNTSRLRRVVAAWGEGVCFALNAVSYVAVLAALLAIRLPRAAPARSEPFAAALRGGLRFAWRTPAIRAALAAVAVTSVVGLSFSTLLPVFARDVLHGGVRGYGLQLAGAGLGSVIGALGAAARRTSGSNLVVLAAQGTLGAGLIALAVERSLPLAALCLVAIGLAVAVQLTTTNGLLQTSSPPELRGRVMSLYQIPGLPNGTLRPRAGGSAADPCAMARRPRPSSLSRPARARCARASGSFSGSQGAPFEEARLHPGLARAR